MRKKPVRGATPGQDSANITIMPASDIFLTPGQAVIIVATTTVQGADGKQAAISWEPPPTPVDPNSVLGQAREPVRETPGGPARYLYQAPNLDYPCQVKKAVVTASVLNAGVKESKAINIQVQSTSCSLNQNNGLASNDTTKVLVTHDGALLVGTKNGLSRFNEFQLPDNKMVLRSNSYNRYGDGNAYILEVVTALAEIDNYVLVGVGQKHWPTFYGWGIARVNFSGNGPKWYGKPFIVEALVTAISYKSVNGVNAPEIATVNNTASSANGGFYESTSVDKLDERNSSAFLDHQNLYAVLVLNGQSIFGGDNGLFVYEQGEQVAPIAGSPLDPKGIFGSGSNHTIRALASDEAGNVWIGLQKGYGQAGGLVKYVPNPAFPRDWSKGTWFGPIQLPYEANDVRALAFDAAGILWVATQKGAYGLKPDGNFVNLGFTAATNLDVRDIAYDAQTNNIWIATNEGVYRWTADRSALGQN
jgi:ligand-binding sensor domain-containing protein